MSFYLEETCNIPFDFAYAKLAEDVIAFCLSHENFPYEAEVNLTLTDNEEIHRINLEYRQIDRPTDDSRSVPLAHEPPRRGVRGLRGRASRTLRDRGRGRSASS